MLSLAGVSVAAFVMMSCKAPPPVPLRPAIGKGLLRVDTTLVLSLGLNRRPPHSARGASMLAHDGSTSTPTATATALALAMVLAFAPMGDAQAAVGVCEGMPPLRSIGCQRAAEAEAETKVHQTPKQQAQLQRLDTQQEVKALQARVATLEKERHQTISSNRETDIAVLSTCLAWLCNIAFGYFLVGVGIPQPDAAIIQIGAYLMYLLSDYF